MRAPWKEEATLLLGIAAAATLAGLGSGWLLPCLLLGLLAYNGWHLYQLLRLPRVYAAGAGRGPYPFGLWRSALAAAHARLAAEHSHAQALETLAVRFRAAVIALPDAAIILDHEDRIIWFNPAAESLLGVSQPAAAGRALPELVTDPVLREYLARGDFTQPLAFSAPTDRARIMSLQVAPLEPDSGLQLLVARDITRQYHTEAAKRDFVANISHELRTPLTVISGLAEQLEMGSRDNPGLQRSSRLMLQQVRRMSEMISDLLTLSRLEMQQAATPEEEVDVADMLGTLVEEARALSGAAAHVVLPEAESAARLRGNARDLRTAFGNLVANAIRHTPPRSEVRVRWCADEQGARFSVSDTGPGIAARHIPRLTERLYRVDPSRSRDTGGSGLGLAIVKHILDRHDARLEISTTVGGGSTFTCHFPAHRVSRKTR